MARQPGCSSPTGPTSARPEAFGWTDLEVHESALRAALAMKAGPDRDDRFVAALSDDGELLADEPYVDWALRPRERLEMLRQQARLALARDRTKGAGNSRLEAVVQAWEWCLEHDPGCEEATAALLRAYSAEGLRHMVVRTYDRCRAALESLGIRPTPALDRIYAATALIPAAGPCGPAPTSAGHGPDRLAQERKVVSVLLADLGDPGGLGSGTDPEGSRRGRGRGTDDGGLRGGGPWWHGDFCVR